MFAFASGYFSVEVPDGFFKVFDAAFKIGAPDVFHRVAQAEIHVLGDLDALNSTLVTRVVFGMIYGVVHCISRVQGERDRKSTRLNSSHIPLSRMPSSA